MAVDRGAIGTGCASPTGEARFALPHGGPSTSFPSISDIARSCARHPWRVIAAWVIVLVAAGFSASGLGDALTTSTNFTGKLESQKGAELLEHRLRGPQPVTETVIVRSDTYTVDQPEFRAKVEEVENDLRTMTGVVKSVTT